MAQRKQQHFQRYLFNSGNKSFSHHFQSIFSLRCWAPPALYMRTTIFNMRTITLHSSETQFFIISPPHKNISLFPYILCNRNKQLHTKCNKNDNSAAFISYFLISKKPQSFQKHKCVNFLFFSVVFIEIWMLCVECE